MGDFFKRGLMVVFICLIIYFIFFFAYVCLKVVFPKLNASKCPQNYEVSLCGDDNDISCCKLIDTSKLGLDPSLNDYFDNLKNNCNKEEIILSNGQHWNPKTYMDDVQRKELCKWSKQDNSSYGDDIDLNEKKKMQRLNRCFVPWDSVTNGLDDENKPIC